MEAHQGVREIKKRSASGNVDLDLATTNGSAAQRRQGIPPAQKATDTTSTPIEIKLEKPA